MPPPSAPTSPCSPQYHTTYVRTHLPREAGAAGRLLEAARQSGGGQRLTREGRGHEGSHGGSQLRCGAAVDEMGRGWGAEIREGEDGERVVSAGQGMGAGVEAGPGGPICGCTAQIRLPAVAVRM